MAMAAALSPENRDRCRAIIDRQTAYLTDVAKGVTLSFGCSDTLGPQDGKRCCWRGSTQADWIHNKWACPHCLRPGKPESSLLSLSLTDPLSGLTFRCPCQWPGPTYPDKLPAFFAQDSWLNTMVTDMSKTTPRPTSEVRTAFVRLSNFLAIHAVPLNVYLTNWHTETDTETDTFNLWPDLIKLLASVLAATTANP